MTDGSGNSQVFYARVIIGKMTDQPDPNRKMPPLLPGSTTERYDSCGNQDMVVVYTNRKVYPEYLITYK